MVCRAMNLHHQEVQKRPLLLASNYVTIKSAETISKNSKPAMKIKNKQGKLTYGIMLLYDVAQIVQDQLNAMQLEECKVHSDQTMMCENLV
jgi:hypothetical protein